jgi:hypothetical protein
MHYLQSKNCPILFSKSFFNAGFIEHTGVFYATTIGLWASVARPRHLTYYASGRQLVETPTRGIPWGLALHNSKASAVPAVLCDCVVAQENPRVLLLQIATSLSFRFPSVIPIAGFLWGIFVQRP